MKYRIRADLIFESKDVADKVWGAMKTQLKNSNLRNIAEEKSFIDYELCGHDEGKPCEKIQRFEKD